MLHEVRMKCVCVCVDEVMKCPRHAGSALRGDSNDSEPHSSRVINLALSTQMKSGQIVRTSNSRLVIRASLTFRVFGDRMIE